MVKLEEMSDGYFVLTAQIGSLTVKRAFMVSDKPLEEISKEPMADGFCLDIPTAEMLEV